MTTDICPWHQIHFMITTSEVQCSVYAYLAEILITHEKLHLAVFTSQLWQCCSLLWWVHNSIFIFYMLSLTAWFVKYVLLWSFHTCMGWGHRWSDGNDPSLQGKNWQVQVPLVSVILTYFHEVYSGLPMEMRKCLTTSFGGHVKPLVPETWPLATPHLYLCWVHYKTLTA